MPGRLLATLVLITAASAQAPPPRAEVPAAQPANPQAAREQAPANQAGPDTRIRVQVDEVIVPVTVTDDKGRFVSDLEVKDFRIYDEGRPQQVRFFTREHNQPVVVGFLLDMSNSSRLHWKKYQEAIIELMLGLLPGEDRYSGYLITYGNEAELVVNTTSDPAKMVERVEKLKPGGGAALFDAIYMACTTRSLVKGEPYEPRRVLIVVGDGHDNASRKTMNEVLEIAQRNLVTVYAMSTQAFGFAAEGDGNLKRLAEETGGRVEYPLEGLYSGVSGHLSNPSDEGNYAYKVGTGLYASEIATGIFKAISAIVGEVTTQYILRYVPDVDQGETRAYRNIRVEVANLPQAIVRARRGYYATVP
jgi:Ca-activated chloride channel homolog